MITEAQFYEQVFSEFKQIRETIDTNYTKMEEKIDDLCDRVTKSSEDIAKTNEKLNTHLAVVKAVDSNETNKVEHRDRNFYIAIALVGVVFSIITLVKG